MGEELKFSSGGNVGRRQAIDDFETHLAEATEKFDRNKGKFERMAKIRTDMKAGIDHLAEKLVPIKLQDEVPVDLSDETVEEVLQVCEHKIKRLMDLTTLDESSSARRMMDEERYEEKLMSQSVARIKLTDKEEEADDDEDDFEGPQEPDEDVPHRKQVKGKSEQILEKQKTKNGKKAKSAKKKEA